MVWQAAGMAGIRTERDGAIGTLIIDNRDERLTHLRSRRRNREPDDPEDSCDDE